uniref:Ig-like domain-containing protein n=1 Tax=Myotis lucifugus TaxID=59463 RepID=G1PZ32_MYOLU
MESPSASSHRGLVPWQGLLLAISLLTFWSPPTTAQLAIVPTNAAEGKDVLLRIRNKPPDAVGFLWYRGEGARSQRNIASIVVDLRVHALGPAYSGREKVNSDGSMLLKRVTRKDTGYYTIVARLRDSKKEIGFGQLRVYHTELIALDSAPSPSASHSGLGLGIYCRTHTVETNFLRSEFPSQIPALQTFSTERRASLIGVTQQSQGPIRCLWFPRPTIGSDPSFLGVLSSEETPNTSGSQGNTLRLDNGGLCSWKEWSPVSQAVSWSVKIRKKSGVVSVSQSLWKTQRYHTGQFSLSPTPNITSNNSNLAHTLCVSAEPVRVPTLLASNTTVMEHKDSVVLTCYTNAVSTQWFFNGMNLRQTERKKLSWNNRTLTIDPVRREDAGNYQCEVSNPISSTESEPVELDVK